MTPGPRRPILCALAVFLFALTTSAQSPKKPAPPRAIVIGFMGGNVAPDDVIRNERIMANRLRGAYPQGVYFQIFENRRYEAAHQKILELIGQTASAGTSPTPVILYGHSWGASAVVTVAGELQKDGVPVALTIQVDSIQKKNQQDAIIPPNVARAINFYQPDGFLHGRAEIRAADPARTQILGNFLVSYKEMPQECGLYPWYERKFIKTHIAIECDPALWTRIESLIRESLPQPTSETATTTTQHPQTPTEPRPPTFQ